jgi:hypothetical protein
MMATPRYGLHVVHEGHPDRITPYPGARCQRWRTIVRDTLRHEKRPDPVRGWGAYNAVYAVLGGDEILRTYLVIEK